MYGPRSKVLGGGLHSSIDAPAINTTTEVNGLVRITPHCCGNSRATWLTQCYLPPGRGDIPALTQAEAGTRLSDPGRMQG